ncbi:MAG: lyase [Gammaproteobacteria bacterium]|nr:MAG: lyase [Gammaproteobacteria bacterium]
MQLKFWTIVAGFLAIAGPGNAATITVKNESGELLAQVMVTRNHVERPAQNLSDDGYTPHAVTNQTVTSVTRFTNALGQVKFSDVPDAVTYRARAQGYVDATFASAEDEVVLNAMTSDQLIASYPSNVWLSQMNFGGDLELKKHFQLNCAFCHQQASAFMRNERTVDQWLAVFERMNGYGARLANDDQENIAELLQKEYRELREQPEVIPQPRTWEPHLSSVDITEWPIGDGFSQMHDFLLHPNGYVYVGDNLFDRIYEVDPDTGDYTVYKVPHPESAQVGGILGNRFTVFPKMHNYMGVHSFAYSGKDGHIFITPSMQQALLEFNPDTKEFTTHWMPEGFYPHTIRVDQKDRVWFTLAVSSQVAMFDRSNGKFSFYDLPARGFKEGFIISALPLIFWMDPENRPIPNPDRDGNGLPMPYGIDVAPDGIIWATRLYANDLARIDPETDEVTMIDFPYQGPRRLRIDSQGNLWIVAFQDSLLVKYDPKQNVFTDYELPVINEIPYSLNIDKKRDVVWVTGNQSDTLLSFDIATEAWKVYPLPRQRFFTRDIEISEDDGAVYTTNSHFPTWQSEGGEPTLLRLAPLEEEVIHKAED